MSRQEEEIQKEIKKLTNEMIKQKRSKEFFKMRFYDTMKELKQLRKDNEPCLVERNKRQEQIIIDLQEELQSLKQAQLKAIQSQKLQDEENMNILAGGKLK